jgi:uncharacterized protein (DUF2147 family)
MMLRPLIASLPMLLSLSLPAHAQHVPETTWRNHHDTVHIRSHACGEGMCGTVIWASEKAMADARRGGHPNLVGMQLFSDFRRDAKGAWHGKVFVPDINKTFAGTLVRTDQDTLSGKGCALGGLICKSLVWYRVPDEK